MKAKTVRTRNPVGWGYVEESLTHKEQQTILQNFSKNLGISPEKNSQAPMPDAVRLSESRISIPAALKDLVSDHHRERLLRACGRSFRDLAMLREKSPLNAPDVIGLPENAADIERILAWAYEANLAVIPFGGGSSVVGGVNPEGMDRYAGVVTIDLQKMNSVREVSLADRVVHADAGILGPDLDAALKEHSLHVRHMPQSYHHSTLGGWVATRGAGHNSTSLTKIEDRVQSLSGILANGKRFDVRPLPATSVAIDPRSYWAGSEGMLGIIDAVRLRVYPLPKHRGFRGIAFETFEKAMLAARMIAQTDLSPVQLRLLDGDEHDQTARLAGREASGRSLMILADESVHDVVESRLDLFTKIGLDHGGKTDEGASRILREWIRLFFRQPYMRDFLMDHSMIVDTFETSIPWSQAENFYRLVKNATRQALQRVCGKFHVGCRATHVYTDGLCLYFSFYGPGMKGSLISQWQEIKNAASEAVIAGGGTISHHHSMGRDHKAFAAKELSETHKLAIAGLKKVLDPKGQMNPGLWFGA